MNTVAEQTILVVEDETITALDIQQSLRRKGFCVPAIACTGQEAVSLAQQHQADLVLMDIRLKGAMDGIEAAEKIRKELNIPIVFLTAYADAATLERAKVAEPFAYLLKPFDETVLATTIEVALHKHNAHQMLLEQSAEALHLSEERFARLADNISDHAVLLLNDAGLILSWSAGAEQVHGWSASEVLGKHVSLLYPPEEISEKKPERDLQSAARAGKHLAYGAQARKNRPRFWAQMVLVALHNTAGRLAGYLKITREVMANADHN